MYGMDLGPKLWGLIPEWYCNWTLEVLCRLRPGHQGEQTISNSTAIVKAPS